MENLFRLVLGSLERGFYQGWDLHGSQLPTRYLANFYFYRTGMKSAGKRLSNYLVGANSGIMDEPATALVLSNYFLRGLNCGAFDDLEIKELLSVSQEQLFEIVKNKGYL